MDHIPIEFLHEIFSKLDLKDKIKCTLVCRSWYTTLDRHSLLYHTLKIPSRQFAKLKTTIESQPHRGNQMEYLTLYSNSYHDFDKRILCNIFPSLRQAILIQNDGNYRRTNHLDSPFQFAHVTSKLDNIQDFGECELTSQLAMSNMCENLKCLELVFKSQCSYNLSQLKNMPVLETLTLRHFRVKLMDLEIVHHNVPSIKSLCLKRITMLYGDIPQDIIPANLITEANLELDGVDDLNTHIQFYKYVAMKYPSVSKPSYDRTVKSRNTRNEDYMRRLYNEAILPLYQNIRPQIDTFYFEVYCNGLDAFRKFDKSGIKLKELGVRYLYDDGPLFFEELAQSKQPKYIQKLTITDIDPSPLELMTKMEVLTYLEIDFSDTYFSYNEKFRNAIDFNQLIEVCPPTLTDLIIKCMRLEFSEQRSNMTSIQYLKLETVKTTLGAAITETNFPELTVLHVEAIMKDHFTISLPNHHLKEVSINIQYPEFEECTISVNTMNEGRSQRNVVRPGHSGKPNYNCIKWELVEFTCASVEKSYYFIYHKNSGYDEISDDDYY